MFLLEIFTPTPLNILSPKSSKKTTRRSADRRPVMRGPQLGPRRWALDRLQGRRGGEGDTRRQKRYLTHALSNYIPTIEFAPALYMDEMAQRSLEFPLDFFLKTPQIMVYKIPVKKNPVFLLRNFGLLQRKYKVWLVDAIKPIS